MEAEAEGVAVMVELLEVGGDDVEMTYSGITREYEMIRNHGMSDATRFDTPWIGVAWTA